MEKRAKATIWDYIALMRPRHYIKNLLVLVPVFFNMELFNLMILLRCFAGLVIFCILASAVYVFNDICDAEKDRNHPKKKDRPIASGKISIHMATCFIAMLMMIVVIMGLASKLDWISSFFLLVYFALNIAYSRLLKRLPLIDVFVLASFYMVRILYGCALDKVQVSFYLCMTVLSAALFMGFGKRRNEIGFKGESGAEARNIRSVLEFYNRSFLDKNMYVSMGMAVIFYAMWCSADYTTARIKSDGLMWTVPIITFVLMRYSFDIENTDRSDPVDILLGDKVLFGSALIYIIIMFVVIYAV